MFPLFATGINNTSEGVIDTGGKFAAGVVDTGGNFAAVVVDTDGAAWISPRIFEKNSKRS